MKKTALVDRMLYQDKLFVEIREFENLCFDSKDLKREGSVIKLSKNMFVRRIGVKINAYKTPLRVFVKQNQLVHHGIAVCYFE